MLSTQALLAQGIENHQLVSGVDFYQQGEVVARGSHEGKTSYLTWVRDENALINESARRISENNCMKRHKRSRKNGRKVIDMELTCRRLGHLGVGRLTHVQNSVQDIDIQGELPKHCTICIRAKKTRIQSDEKVIFASQPLHLIYMDFWGPYPRGSIDGSQYILTLTKDKRGIYGLLSPRSEPSRS